MVIRITKDEISYQREPDEFLNKSNIMKGEIDEAAASGSSGHPYAEPDIKEWNSIRLAGYHMKLNEKGFSVHKDGKEIGTVGNSNPGSPLTAAELRNMFHQSVGIATNHQAAEGSRALREGVQPQFLSGEVWGDQGTIPDDQETVNLHDGAPLDELKEEAVPVEANGHKDDELFGEVKKSEGSFSDYLSRKKNEYGDKFDDSNLNKEFVPHFESQKRVEVTDQFGGKTKGRIGVTTGWKPAFLLMTHGNSKGSSYVIGPKHKVTEIVKSEDAHKSLQVTEEDLLAKSTQTIHNQGWGTRIEKAHKDEPYDVTSAIMAHEQGDLDDEGTVKLFQHLVDTGMVNHLQGHYGRTAHHLIASGLVNPPKKQG